MPDSNHRKAGRQWLTARIKRSSTRSTATRTITLNRPEALNALAPSRSPELVDRLRRRGERRRGLAADRHRHRLAFCTGADVTGSPRDGKVINERAYLSDL